MSINLWTDDRIGMLRDLWKEGHSARQIAMRIGAGVSRNAVIGKAHRLGLSQRQMRPLRRPVAAETGEEFKTCQWPLGDPGEAGFEYCGRETVMTKPYCRQHCGVAYLNVLEEEVSD